MTERELFEKVTPEFLETLKNIRADLELETKSCL